MKNILITALLIITATLSSAQQLVGTKHSKGETFAQFVTNEPGMAADMAACGSLSAAELNKHKKDFLPNTAWQQHAQRELGYAVIVVNKPFSQRDKDQCRRYAAAQSGMMVEIVRPAPASEMIFNDGKLVSFGERREGNHGHTCVDYNKLYNLGLEDGFGIVCY